MKAIDLFAGLGGFSEGARNAGVRVVWAGNHWRASVDIHQANHPDTAHECQDLNQANWHALPKHDLGLGSPACQGHTRARGIDRPHHDACRSTAWAIIACAEVHRQPLWVVENVPEFLKWALYPAWKQAMEALGYSVSPHIVDAADHGVPQNRVRVFIICTRSRSPLVLNLPRRPHVAFDSCIDVLSSGWSAVATKCPNTRARVSAGRRVHGRRFLIAYYGNEKGGRSLQRPIGTITTRDRYALIEGNEMRMINVEEYRRGMGFRPDYKLPSSSTVAKHMLGNAVSPVVATDIINSLKAAA
ncbi:MAG TPA: DNA cytosine methyltransferase [Rariglobus sp.]|nr:DNA cytosine methyltransferase [Rariglobus sp.]